MNEELISIIVPVYNVEKYIKRCIDSILEQSYKNIEIIIVDDGSTDRSGKICDLYKDIRIKVFHKENGGVSDARNFGIKKATGKFITFVDSDDYVEKDYVNFLVKTIKETNSDISICSYRIDYENGKKIFYGSCGKMQLTQQDILEKMLYNKDLISTWGKLYKKELFNNIEFPNGEIHEDVAIIYKLILKSKNISCNMQSLYNYCKRPNSITTSSFTNKNLKLIDFYEQMGKDILNIYPNLEKAVVRGNVYSRFCVLRKMLNSKNRDKKLEKEFRRYILKKSKSMLFNTKAEIRDKIAIMCIFIGNWFFKLCWNCYSSLSGRI